MLRVREFMEKTSEGFECMDGTFSPPVKDHGCEEGKKDGCRQGKEKQVEQWLCK